MEGGGEIHNEHEQRALRERNVLCMYTGRQTNKESLLRE